MEEKLTREDFVLIYLLMSVDGEISEMESTRFDELLEAYELKAEKNSLIGMAQDILEQLPPDEKNNMESLYALYKKAIIKKHSGGSASQTSTLTTAAFLSLGTAVKAEASIFSGIIRKKRKMLLLWTMVNMSFADQIIAANERQFLVAVAHDIDCEWSIVEQMLDAAKALYALDVQRNWLKTEVSKPYEEIEILVKEFDKNQEIIKNNIAVLF